MIAYRSIDGTTIFHFEFARLRDHTLRIYIRQQPEYDGRDDGPVLTHRKWDDTGPYICWTDPILTDSAARAIAKRWAEKTLNYIRHGTHF